MKYTLKTPNSNFTLLAAVVFGNLSVICVALEYGDLAKAFIILALITMGHRLGTEWRNKWS